jgi:hypothetical protein
MEYGFQQWQSTALRARMASTLAQTPDAVAEAAFRAFLAGMPEVMRDAFKSDYLIPYIRKFQGGGGGGSGGPY